MPATVAGVHLGPDTHANRPAANASGLPIGSLYSCTDHSLIYKTDGSAWATWATLGSGGTASAVAAYNSVDLALSTAGEAIVTMDSELYDTDTYHDIATNTGRFTVPTGLGGKFGWTLNVRVSANVNGYIAVRKNNLTILGLGMVVWSTGMSVGSITASGEVDLVATDYIEIKAAMSAAVNAVSAARPWFTISRIGS